MEDEDPMVGRVLVQRQDRWKQSKLPSPPSPEPKLGGLRAFFLMFLPPPKSSFEFWDDADVAEVIWNPTRLGLLIGDRPYIKFFERPDDGGWFDKETGEAPNRWLFERLETEWKKARSTQ